MEIKIENIKLFGDDTNKYDLLLYDDDENGIHIKIDKKFNFYMDINQAAQLKDALNIIIKNYERENSFDKKIEIIRTAFSRELNNL